MAALRRMLTHIGEYLHLALLVLTGFLIISSPWILIGSRLPSTAGLLSHAHVYVGLVAALASLLFLYKNCVGGKWRQYFCWLAGDLSQIKKDLMGLTSGRIPVAGGRGIFSVVEGLGMLLLVAVGISGGLWVFYQGDSGAMMWRGYHIMLAQSFVVFLMLHIVFAGLHLLDFVRN